MGEECSLSAGSSFWAFGVNKDADKGNLKRGTVPTTVRQFRSLPSISSTVAGGSAAYEATSFCIFDWFYFKFYFWTIESCQVSAWMCILMMLFFLFYISNSVLKTAVANSTGQNISASSTAHLSFWYLFYPSGFSSMPLLVVIFFSWNQKSTSLGCI